MQRNHIHTTVIAIVDACPKAKDEVKSSFGAVGLEAIRRQVVDATFGCDAIAVVVAVVEEFEAETGWSWLCC